MNQPKPTTKTKMITYITITQEVDGTPDSATVEASFAEARKVRESHKKPGSEVDVVVTIGTQKLPSDERPS